MTSLFVMWLTMIYIAFNCDLSDCIKYANVLQTKITE